MLKTAKQKLTEAAEDGKRKEERMEEAYDLDRISELSEDEQIEAFAWALGQLTEDELNELIFRCRDIIDAVEERRKGGKQDCA